MLCLKKLENIKTKGFVENQISIRKATQKDLPTLLNFEQRIVEYERPYDPTLRKGEINYYPIKEYIDRNDIEIVVAVTNEMIIASGYVKIIAAKPYLKFDNYAYLGFMYVEPDYRGRGINKSIIQVLTKWAKSKGLNELRLDVYSENKSAISAYHKAGFTSNLLNMRIEI